MPQKAEVALSRAQAAKNPDIRKLLAASTLGPATKDRLAVMSAKSKITLTEFKDVLAKRRSLPEILAAKKNPAS